MKKFILFALCINLAFAAHSQKTTSSTTDFFAPHWYIGANAGYNTFMGEGNNILRGLFTNNNPYYYNFKDNAGFQGRALVGYNFTPVIGVRGMLGYFTSKWPNASSTDLYKFSSEHLTADVTFNLSNTDGYNPNRKFDFIVFAGLGMGYRNSDFKDNLSPISGLLRGGLQTDYHLTKSLDINLILDGNMTTDNYNDFSVNPLPFDLVPSISVGIAYRLPSKNEKQVTEEPAVIPTVTEPKEIPEVVAPEVEKPMVAEEPAAPEVQTPVEPKEEETVAPAEISDKINEHIFFTISQREIQRADQREAMQRIADFIVAHPESKVIISGYADRGTGTVEINNKLSKQRAVIVANTLIREFDVPYKNIWVRWFGSGVQPYAKATLNRLVIVRGAASFKEANAIPSLKKESTNVVNSKATPATVAAAAKANASATETPESALFKIIHFNEKAFEITDQKTKAEMKLVAEYLKRNPAAMASISGYADNAADDEKVSTELSKQRAEAVANALIKDYSISAERVQVRWYGAQKENGTTPSMNKMVLISTAK